MSNQTLSKRCCTLRSSFSESFLTACEFDSLYHTLLKVVVIVKKAVVK